MDAICFNENVFLKSIIKPTILEWITCECYKYIYTTWWPGFVPVETLFLERRDESSGKKTQAILCCFFFFFFAAQWTWDMSLDQSHGTMSTLGCIRQPEFSRGESHIPFSHRQRLSGLLCVPSTVVDPDSTYCGVICGSMHPIIVCVCEAVQH